MKNIVFFILIFFFAGFVSCTKTHSAYPTPPGYRFQNVEIVSHVNGGPLSHEIYNIYYDNKNRVAEFIYSIEDTSFKKLDIYFIYADSINKIYKYYYELNDTILLRVDSFQYNYAKQIIEEWTPTENNTFQYNGKLLTKMINAQSLSTIYTAHNGDFYKSNSTISFDSTESFIFYLSLNNRMGDYLQLRSFLVFGQNIYQNSHLLRSATSVGYDNNITYIIDADGKITQTNAVITDSVGNTYNYTYNIGYEISSSATITTTPPIEVTSMQATINGVPFYASNCDVYVSSGTPGFVDIRGYNGTFGSVFPDIKLSLPGYNKTTGTFAITLTGGVAQAFIDSSIGGSSFLSGGSGTLTITSASAARIVGTFSFTCMDGTVVTDGRFTSKGY